MGPPLAPSYKWSMAFERGRIRKRDKFQHRSSNPKGSALDTGTHK